jgi:peptidoglycan-associated lipoprotein
VRRTINVLMVAAMFAMTGCPKKTAELELDLAKKAVDDARAAKANDCAKETFMAAEAALAEAQALEQQGEAEQAKEKANQAKSLAEQALAASPKDCDQPKVADDEEKDTTTDASAGMNLPLDQVIQTVYFDYNDASIREDSKAMLTRVAQALSQAPAAKLEIEGHCDVRGSTEYNLHLGERRARNVQKYLVTQGVQPDRLDVISYGEEQPLDLGTDEGAHQKNRRAELKKDPQR